MHTLLALLEMRAALLVGRLGMRKEVYIMIRISPHMRG